MLASVFPGRSPHDPMWPMTSFTPAAALAGSGGSAPGSTTGAERRANSTKRANIVNPPKALCNERVYFEIRTAPDCSFHNRLLTPRHKGDAAALYARWVIMFVPANAQSVGGAAAAHALAHFFGSVRTNVTARPTHAFN